MNQYGDDIPASAKNAPAEHGTPAANEYFQ